MSALGSFLAGAVAATAPILVTAIGGAFAERARYTNIAMDGMMLAAAFAALSVAVVTGSAWIGLGAAIAVGVLAALMMSWIVQVLRCDLIIVGIGFNMLVSGATLLLLNVLYAEPGTYSPFDAPTLPRIRLGAIDNHFPLIGEIFDRQSILIPIILAVFVAVWIIEKRSVFGAHVIAVGSNENAAAAVGLSITRIRTMALVASGATAGIGGAFLAISALGVFSVDMTGGIGFIALAAIFFGGASTTKTALASVIFGLAYAASTHFQGSIIPVQFVLMTPYLATIAALLLMGLYSRARGRPLISPDIASPVAPNDD